MVIYLEKALSTLAWNRTCAWSAISEVSWQIISLKLYQVHLTEPIIRRYFQVRLIMIFKRTLITDNNIQNGAVPTEIESY